MKIRKTSRKEEETKLNCTTILIEIKFLLSNLIQFNCSNNNASTNGHFVKILNNIQSNRIVYLTHLMQKYSGSNLS